MTVPPIPKIEGPFLTKKNPSPLTFAEFLWAQSARRIFCESPHQKEWWEFKLLCVAFELEQGNFSMDNFKGISIPLLNACSLQLK